LQVGAAGFVGASMGTLPSASAAPVAIRYATGGGLKRSELESYFVDADKAGEIMSRNLNRAANLVTSFKQVAVDQTSSMRRNFLLDEVVAEILLTLWPTLKSPPPHARSKPHRSRTPTCRMRGTHSGPRRKRTRATTTG